MAHASFCFLSGLMPLPVKELLLGNMLPSSTRLMSTTSECASSVDDIAWYLSVDDQHGTSITSAAVV